MSSYKTARLLTLARDGWRCLVCGGSERLTTHHRVPRHLSRNDRPANLIVVCRSCHDFAEELDRLPAALDWLPYLIKGDTRL
jgi:5-methylcytosine-specific restriction endonuclease McrA